MQRLFFATADDLISIFDRVEAKHRLLYTLCGLFPSNDTTSISSGAAIPTLRSAAPYSDFIACPQYLVTPANHDVTVRDVAQTKGGVLYAIDQSANSESIVVRPGGIFPPDVLLHGSVGSISSSPFSMQVYRAFTSAITKSFRHVRVFYVGPQAYEFWQKGYRLTSSIQSPKEYDLAK